MFGGNHFVNVGNLPINTGYGGVRLHSGAAAAVTSSGVNAFAPSPVNSSMFGGPFFPSTSGPTLYVLLNYADGYIQAAQRTGSATFADGTTVSWAPGVGW
jgi:hypothetical protein